MLELGILWQRTEAIAMNFSQKTWSPRWRQSSELSGKFWGSFSSNVTIKELAPGCPSLGDFDPCAKATIHEVSQMAVIFITLDLRPFTHSPGRDLVASSLLSPVIWVCFHLPFCQGIMATLSSPISVIHLQEKAFTWEWGRFSPQKFPHEWQKCAWNGSWKPWHPCFSRSVPGETPLLGLVAIWMSGGMATTKVLAWDLGERLPIRADNNNLYRPMVWLGIRFLFMLCSEEQVREGVKTRWKGYACFRLVCPFLTGTSSLATGLPAEVAYPLGKPKRCQVRWGTSFLSCPP